MYPYAQATHGVKLGFMSCFIKAAAKALKAEPAVNAIIDGRANHPPPSAF